MGIKDMSIHAFLTSNTSAKTRTCISSWYGTYKEVSTVRWVRGFRSKKTWITFRAGLMSEIFKRDIPDRTVLTHWSLSKGDMLKLEEKKTYVIRMWFLVRTLHPTKHTVPYFTVLFQTCYLDLYLFIHTLQSCFTIAIDVEIRLSQSATKKTNRVHCYCYGQRVVSE